MVGCALVIWDLLPARVGTLGYSADLPASLLHTLTAALANTGRERESPPLTPVGVTYRVTPRCCLVATAIVVVARGFQFQFSFLQSYALWDLCPNGDPIRLLTVFAVGRDFDPFARQVGHTDVPAGRFAADHFGRLGAMAERQILAVRRKIRMVDFILLSTLDNAANICDLRFAGCEIDVGRA